jgi:ABC-type spermidine/putrescine transport system permease subunit II
MSPDFITSVLGKVFMALLPTFVFMPVCSLIEMAFNQGEIEGTFDAVFGLTCIFFGAVYLWQNR